MLYFQLFMIKNKTSKLPSEMFKNLDGCFTDQFSRLK